MHTKYLTALGVSMMVASILLATVTLVLVFAGVFQDEQPAPTPTPVVECVVGVAYFESPEWDGLLIQVGETSICGENLYAGDLIVGPDYDSYITDLENELDRWIDCVKEGLCRNDMVRGP